MDNNIMMGDLGMLLLGYLTMLNSALLIRIANLLADAYSKPSGGGDDADDIAEPAATE